MDTLNGYSNLAEDPHFKSRITELLTLKVRHLETEGPHQVVVEQGGGGGGEWGGTGRLDTGTVFLSHRRQTPFHRYRTDSTLLVHWFELSF